MFALGHLAEWRENNPAGTIDAYLTECRQQTAQAKERLIEIEVENGSTRESAERMARQML